MHPDAMRRIDRHAGTPLCRVVTLIERLRPSPAPAGPPRRILFICLAEIGALFIAHPALRAAQRRFGDVELWFMTFATGSEALALMGIPAERRLILDPSSLGGLIGSAAKALQRVRAAGIDTTVNLEVYARFSTLLAWASGAGRRVGFHRFAEEGHDLGDLLTHKVIYNPHRHVADSYLSLVAAAAEPASSEPRAKTAIARTGEDRLRILSDDAGLAAIQAKLRAACPALEDRHRLVILNANASDLVALRRWPDDNYVALAKRLLERDDIAVVLTGAPSETGANAGLAARIGHPRVANMAGRTSFRELIDLYNACHAMVTNDSGPAHFASATDLPTLVLFGPETPDIFGPVGPRQQALYLGLACSPCVSVYNQKRSLCTDNLCLKDITVDAVLARTRALIGDRP
ncbi:MAG: glycosyltransferase family 9 protein [Alphaproteobacteria bacterium]|nr:glycosyltransferase family 9 protein [Alphaproteobacteria bacterium]